MPETLTAGSFILMRRKIRHSKRYRDYPRNVPKRLIKLFFDLNRSVSRLAMSRGVNSGTVSALLNDGKEPKSNSIRTRLWLTINPICKSCGRKIINRKPNNAEPRPQFIIDWNHLPTAERHKVIQEYLRWKSLQKI